MNYNPKCLIQKNCNPEGHLPVSRLLKVNVSIVFFLFLFIWSVLIIPAAAHGTYMSSSLGGIDVKAWYTGGEPMADTPYEVYTIRYDDNGNEIKVNTGKTCIFVNKEDKTFNVNGTSYGAKN